MKPIFLICLCCKVCSSYGAHHFTWMQCWSDVLLYAGLIYLARAVVACLFSVSCWILWYMASRNCLFVICLVLC